MYCEIEEKKMMINIEKLKNKKVAIFGTGNIAKSLLDNSDCIKPDIFIDNYPRADYFHGVKVVKPVEIINIRDFYIVIATMAYDSIKKQLINYGLKEGDNFCYYKQIFNSYKSVYSTLKNIEDFIDSNNDYIGCELMNGFFITGRKNELLISFFKRYSKRDTKYIFIAHTTAINEEKASKLLENIFFDLPDLLNWQGAVKEYINLSLEEDLMKNIALKDKESEFIKELQKIYKIEDIDLSIRVCTLIMKFYKRLLAIIKPSKILIGTDLKPEWRILYYLAKEQGIPGIFWEYGWIPGTLQFENNGSAGRSLLAKDGEYYNKLRNIYSNETIDKIKEYIKEKQIDTTEFLESESDLNELKKLKEDKKTIFLIGAGLGFLIDSKSAFFKKNISEIYETEEQILLDLIKLSVKYDLNIIYKPHPGIVNSNTYKRDESIVWIDSMSVDELISKADVVITVYSAVDFKVLLYEKPLIQLGHSILDKAECSYIVNNKGDIENKILEALKNGITQEQINNFNILIGKLLTNISWWDGIEREITYGRPITDDIFDIYVDT